MPFSQLALGGVLAFGAGIFFAPFAVSSALLVLGLLVAGIALLSVFWKRGRGMAVGLLLLAAALGMAHYATAARLPEPLPEPREVSFQGRVALPLERDEQGTRMVVEAGPGSGRVLVFTSSFQEIRQGDIVQVAGKLSSPQAFDNFNYPLFLAKDRVYFVMIAPAIEVRERGFSALSSLREKMQEKIDAFFPVPESSLLSAMLLGNKAGLPQEFALKLNATGTRHITAVSGMHVAILSGMLFALALNLGLARAKSSLLVFAFLVFFVAFTGFQASAVRAGIMASSFLLAGLLGRRNDSLRILVFAAALMLLFNPLLLGHDIGFQLSFLAVLGILLFVPVLQHFLRRFPNPFGLRDVVFMSAAAQVFTLPLLLHHFGMLSLVSLVSNLAIVPLLPLALLLGVLVLAFGMLAPLVAGVFAFPAGLVLSYVSFVVETLSALPFAASQAEGPAAWLLLAALLPPAFFAWKFRGRSAFPRLENVV